MMAKTTRNPPGGAAESSALLPGAGAAFHTATPGCSSDSGHIRGQHTRHSKSELLCETLPPFMVPSFLQQLRKMVHPAPWALCALISGFCGLLREFFAFGRANSCEHITCKQHPTPLQAAGEGLCPQPSSAAISPGHVPLHCRAETQHSHRALQPFPNLSIYFSLFLSFLIIFSLCTYTLGFCLIFFQDSSF